MTSDPNHIHETIVVNVGVLGSADTGTGTAFVDIRLDGTPEGERGDVVGQLLGEGYRRAFIEAIQDFRPKLTKHWLDQARRDVEGGV